MTRFLIVLLGLVCVAASPAGAQQIKYEKYKLNNGLTVILHQDRSLPVGAVNIWYRVGSKDEPARRSGFAHLFEHLMFMGTRRVPGNQFDVIMEEGGGANNASTSSDRTNYFSSGPASLLPTLLWLDADRLEDLGRTMDQAKLDKQRDVVRNERRQSYENRPYGKADLAIESLMFPPGHPYHIPVIGTHEDLEAASVADVKDFFANYYVPCNASLVVAGDFDPAVIKPLIADLFGSIPRSVEPAHRTAPPVKLDRTLRSTTTDEVQLVRISFVYHSPAQFADGDAEMDLVAALLTEGKTSRLYKRLVFDDKLAAEVSAYQASAQFGSLFYIEVMVAPGADLDAVERAVDEEVSRLVQGGISPEELEQRKSAFELAMLSRMQSVEARADLLNQYEYFFGEPDSFARDLDRYRKATPESVQSWARRVLTPDARLIMRVLPNEPPVEAVSAREMRPEDFSPKPFDPASPRTFTLSSGIPVMLWQREELPLVAVEMLFKPAAGPITSPLSAGLPMLTARMLGEGAGDRDALAFSDAMQALGARFFPGADTESLSISLTVLRRNFDRAMDLVGDAIRRPRLTQSDWDRVQRLHLDDLRQQDDEPTVVAGRVAMRAFFGDDNPYGWPLAGTAETVGAIKLQDIRAQYERLVRPDLATILIAGDISESDAKATLERIFAGWKPGSSELPAVAPAAPPKASDRLRVVIVDRPEAVQTVVRFVMPAPRYADERRVPDRLISTILGGSFTSRLNQNLREDKGYTYGARAGYTLLPTLGYLTASSSVRADVTGPSVGEFLGEFKRLRAGDIADQEAVKARETLRTNVVQAFQGLSGILSSASERLVAGLPFESLAADMAAMQTIDAAALNRLASAAVPLEQGVLVLVGDKKLILEQLMGLDLPEPVELDIHGATVTGATRAAP
jgi:predicted Zn-dependent peptidase